MTNHASKIDRDLVTEALSLLEDAHRVLDESGLMDDPNFRAYHAASLQGQEHGWLGGPFLIDAVRAAAEEIDECPECGGWTGVGEEPEGDYDECDCG